MVGWERSMQHTQHSGRVSVARKRRPKTMIDVRRDKVLKARRIKLNIKTFKTEEKAISRRIAHFLFWGAQRYPRQILTHEEITQAVLGLGKVPARGATSVKSIKSSMSRAGQVLKSRYSCEKVSVVGVGCRATIDDLDIVENSMPKKADKLNKAIGDFQATAGLVSPERLKMALAELPAAEREEMTELAEWFSSSLLKCSKMLKRRGSEQGLLPPPPTKDED